MQKNTAYRSDWLCTNNSTASPAPLLRKGATMDKVLLSERDICTKFITPALQAAGWQQHEFREKVQLTAGRVMVRVSWPLG